MTVLRNTSSEAKERGVQSAKRCNITHLLHYVPP